MSQVLPQQQTNDKGFHLLINGWQLTVTCKVNQTSIKQVVIRCEDRPGLHLTYHESKGVRPKKTHLVLDKKKRNKHQLIVEWEGPVASTNWWLFPDKKYAPQYNRKKHDLIVNSEYDYTAFCFWITPTGTEVSNNHHIYFLSNSQIDEHKHKEPKNGVFSILRCSENELDIEILQTCCPAIKREKFDKSNRDFNAISQELGIVNTDGRFELRRIINTSIFSND